MAQDLKDNFTRVFDLALKKKVDYVFIVGDLFENNQPSPDLVKYVSEQVKRLSANGIRVAGIAGDHDKPVNHSAWVHLTGIMPINQLKGDVFVGFDYSDNSADNIAKLVELEHKENVEWIFLHGQAPELFPFCEEKKKLDFKSIDLINDFPALRGVVLGDIHKPLEGTIADPTMTRNPEPFIGYCGSLGVVKTDEIGFKEGVLYFDGDTLSRLPFELGRKFIKLNLSEAFEPINWIVKYRKFFQDYKGKQPVFIVEYDRFTKNRISEIVPLYEVGIVKISLSRKLEDGGKQETVNIRSELKTNDRIEKTLRLCAPEKAVYSLALELLTSDDPKATLDQFKQAILK